MCRAHRMQTNLTVHIFEISILRTVESAGNWFKTAKSESRIHPFLSFFSSSFPTLYVYSHLNVLFFGGGQNSHLNISVLSIYCFIVCILLKISYMHEWVLSEQNGSQHHGPRSTSKGANTWIDRRTRAPKPSSYQLIKQCLLTTYQTGHGLHYYKFIFLLLLRVE